MAWTTPRTWVEGELVTAALLNAQLRDNILSVSAGAGGWTTFGSPTWLGSGSNPTFTTQTSKYCQMASLVIFVLRYDLLTPGSGTYSFGIPVTAEQGNSVACGGGTLYDVAPGGSYHVSTDVLTTGTIRALTDERTSNGILAATVPYTWATPDLVYLTNLYEAAV